LERYPSDIWSEYARYELKQLERQERLAAIPQREPPSPAPSPDIVAWEDIKDTADPDALRRFIQRVGNTPRDLRRSSCTSSSPSIALIRWLTGAAACRGAPPPS
jgi:hypothetical protein